MMLPFFPTPYPDELFFSIVARYHEWNINPGQKDSIEDLFGVRTACAVVDLPCRLEQFSAQLSSGTRLTGDYIIDNHTLFPMYRAFLPKSRAELIRRYMLEGNDGGKIHTTAGIMASKISAPLRLRFCVDCASREFKYMGEAYWHRCHQVSGVSICNVHRRPLSESIAIPSLSSKHRFCTVNEQLIGDGDAIKIDPLCIDHYMFLAEGVTWLLNSHVGFTDLNVIQQRYIGYLQDKSLATISGRVRIKELISEFSIFYGSPFLEELNCAIEGQDNWLCKLVRKPRSAMHPIKHLLLMRFCGMTPEQFFTNKCFRYSPFGIGPWPCLNAASKHYRRLVVHKCSVSRDYKLGVPVGTFECSCGFIYSRRGPDYTKASQYRIGRIKRFGKVWDDKLKELLSKDLSLRAMGRELMVDPMTVKKQMQRLDGSNQEPGKGVKHQSCPQGGTPAEYYKNRWLQIRCLYPDLGRTELRSLVPEVFTWLYRHEKDWLEDNSPKALPRKKYDDRRVDWELRDLELSGSIFDASTIIRNSPKPVRVTLSSLAKEIGHLGLIQRHLNKLPKTAAAIENVKETKEDFQIRRVYRVVRILRENDEDLKPWKIIKLAGLRPGFPPLIQSYIGSWTSRQPGRCNY